MGSVRGNAEVELTEFANQKKEQLARNLAHLQSSYGKLRKYSQRAADITPFFQYAWYDNWVYFIRDTVSVTAGNRWNAFDAYSDAITAYWQWRFPDHKQTTISFFGRPLYTFQDSKAKALTNAASCVQLLATTAAGLGGYGFAAAFVKSALLSWEDTVDTGRRLLDPIYYVNDLIKQMALLEDDIQKAKELLADNNTSEKDTLFLKDVIADIQKKQGELNDDLLCRIVENRKNDDVINQIKTLLYFDNKTPPYLTAAKELCKIVQYGDEGVKTYLEKNLTQTSSYRTTLAKTINTNSTATDVLNAVVDQSKIKRNLEFAKKFADSIIWTTAALGMVALVVPGMQPLAPILIAIAAKMCGVRAALMAGSWVTEAISASDNSTLASTPSSNTPVFR